MRSIELDQILAFHSQLVGLTNVGIPLILDEASQSVSLETQLDQINTRIAQRLSEGTPLQEILRDDNQLPNRYRRALWLWCIGGASSESLEALTSEAEGRREISRDYRYSFLSPLILASAGYMAFLLLIYHTVPTIEAMYLQVGEHPRGMLSVLLVLRQSILFWAPAIPIALLGFALFVRSNPRFSLDWLPGMRYYRNRLAYANFARTAAAAQVAQTGDEELNSSEGHSPGLQRPSPPNMDCASESVPSTTAIDWQKWIPAGSGPLPPLMRWALGERESKTSTGALQFASKIYRQQATDYLNTFKFWAATILGCGIGSAIVLMLALCLFTPLFDLLLMLVQPARLVR